MKSLECKVACAIMFIVLLSPFLKGNPLTVILLINLSDEISSRALFFQETASEFHHAKMDNTKR
jgi:hypothetical protein